MPYLLLSVFVDFVHLHRLISGPGRPDLGARAARQGRRQARRTARHLVRHLPVAARRHGPADDDLAEQSRRRVAAPTLVVAVDASFPHRARSPLPRLPRSSPLPLPLDSVSVFPASVCAVGRRAVRASRPSERRAEPPDRPSVWERVLCAQDFQAQALRRRDVLVTAWRAVRRRGVQLAGARSLSADDGRRGALALDRNQALRAQRLTIDASKADEITAALKPNLDVVVRRRRVHAVLADHARPRLPEQRRQLRRARPATSSSAAASGQADCRRRRRPPSRPATACATRSGSCGSRPSRPSSTSCWPSRRSSWRSRTSRASPTSSTSTGSASSRAIWPRRTSSRSRCRSCSSSRTCRPRRWRWCRPRRRCGSWSASKRSSDDFDVDRRSRVRGPRARASRTSSGRRWIARPDLQAAHERRPARAGQRWRSRRATGRATSPAGWTTRTSGPQQRARRRRLVRPAVPRSEPGQHRAAEVAVRRRPRPRTGDPVTSCSPTSSTRTRRSRRSEKVVDALRVGLSRSGEAVARHQPTYVFQRGAGSLLDLLDAERTYRDTQLAYRQALAELHDERAAAQLRRGKTGDSMKHGYADRLVLALALPAACGGSATRHRRRAKAAAAAQAGAPSAAAYFTVPPEQLAHVADRAGAPRRRGRRGPDDRHGRLGQRPHDAGDHPGERPDHAHRSCDTGAHVKAGDPLLYVASPDITQRHLGLPQGEEPARSGAANLDRNKDLLEHKAIAQRDFESAQADYNDAETDVQTALQALKIFGVTAGGPRRRRAAERDDPAGAGDARRRSPGTVVQKLVMPGQIIQAGTTVAFVISDVSTRLGAGAHLREGPARRSHVGDAAEIRSSAVPRRLPRHGRLHRRHARSGDAHDAGPHRHDEHRRVPEEGPVRRRRRSATRRARDVLVVPTARGALRRRRTCRSSTCRWRPASSRSARSSSARSRTIRPRSSTASRTATASSSQGSLFLQFANTSTQG